MDDKENLAELMDEVEESLGIGTPNECGQATLLSKTWKRIKKGDDMPDPKEFSGEVYDKDDVDWDIVQSVAEDGSLDGDVAQVLLQLKARQDHIQDQLNHHFGRAHVRIKARLDAVEKESGIRHVEQIAEISAKLDEVNCDGLARICGLEKRIDNHHDMHIENNAKHVEEATRYEQLCKRVDELGQYQHENHHPKNLEQRLDELKEWACQQDDEYAALEKELSGEKPDPPLSERLVCPMCDGKGYGETDDTADLEVECPNCDGEGTIIALPEGGKPESTAWEEAVENMKLLHGKPEDTQPQPGDLCWFWDERPLQETDVNLGIYKSGMEGEYIGENGTHWTNCERVHSAEVDQLRIAIDALKELAKFSSFTRHALAKIGNGVTITRRKK